MVLRGLRPRFEPAQASRTLLQRPPLFQARFAASSVSNRPGSQTLEHAAQNVREEVGNSAADWAKAIAAGNFTQDSVKTDTDPTFVKTSVSVCPKVLFIMLP
jgi:cell pole-organizing protein PopZ